MSHVGYIKGLLMNLNGEVQRGRGYTTKENALELLKKRTGQDFGYDVEAWKKWIKENKNELEQRLIAGKDKA